MKLFPGLGHGGAAALGLEHLEILGHHELFGQGFAQVVVVVDEKDVLELCHVVRTSLVFRRR